MCVPFLAVNSIINQVTVLVTTSDWIPSSLSMSALLSQIFNPLKSFSAEVSPTKSK